MAAKAQKQFGIKQINIIDKNLPISPEENIEETEEAEMPETARDLMVNIQINSIINQGGIGGYDCGDKFKNNISDSYKKDF